MSQSHLFISQRLQFCSFVQKREGFEEKRRMYCVLKNDLLTAFFWIYFQAGWLVQSLTDYFHLHQSVDPGVEGSTLGSPQSFPPCANSSGAMQYRAPSVRGQGRRCHFQRLGQTFQCPTHSSPNVTGAAIGRTRTLSGHTPQWTAAHPGGLGCPCNLSVNGAVQATILGRCHPEFPNPRH